MGKRQLVPIFLDQREALGFASDADIGAAVRAALAFADEDTPPTLDGMAGMLCSILCAQYLRNIEDSANGGKGGRPRAKTGVLENETKDTYRDINREKVNRDISEREERETRDDPPAREEVHAYFSSCALSGDTDAFCDFYAARGWRVGGEPVSDWRALANSWSRREAKYSAPASKPKSADPNAWMDAYLPPDNEVER